MILAIVIAAQLATDPNPCADQMAELCKISPYFCADAYPADMVPGTNGIPCWPERSIAPVSKGAPSSNGRSTNSVRRQSTAAAAAAAPAVSAPASSGETIRERFARAVSRLVRLSTP